MPALQAYIEYFAAVVAKAAEYDICVYVDPHQDVWSRFSGGSGAPAWTFSAVGLDVRAFEPTGAALVHQTHCGGGPDALAAFPRMCWPTNLHKLACGTMFTLFWGGRTTAEPPPNALASTPPSPSLHALSSRPLFTPCLHTCRRRHLRTAHDRQRRASAGALTSFL